jgi:hypothetical protein
VSDESGGRGIARRDIEAALAVGAPLQPKFMSRRETSACARCSLVWATGAGSWPILILDGDTFCLGLNRVRFRDRSIKPNLGLLTGLKRGLIDWLTIALDHGLRGDPHDRLRIARRLTRLLLHPNGTRCNVGYGACDIRHARRQTLLGCSAA